MLVQVPANHVTIDLFKCKPRENNDTREDCIVELFFYKFEMMIGNNGKFFTKIFTQSVVAPIIFLV